MSEYVDPEDLTVQRDENDEILPEDAQAGRFGKIQVRPMTYGKVQKKFGDGQQFDFGADDLADLFREHIVRPDLDEFARGEGYAELTGEFIDEEMYPLAPRDLLMAVLDASGVEADVEATEGGGATVAVEGN